MSDAARPGREPKSDRRLAALGVAVAALAFALYAAIASRPPPPPVPTAPPAEPSLAMAACTGAVAESPDDPLWKIPLDKCDKAIDAIDVKAGFVSKWSICGGAKSFEVTLDPSRGDRQQRRRPLLIDALGSERDLYRAAEKVTLPCRGHRPMAMRAP